LFQLGGSVNFNKCFLALLIIFSQVHLCADGCPLDYYKVRVIARAAKNNPFRDYNVPVTKSEKDDLTHIVHTLARSSLAKLGTSKSSLKKVGDRIDHLHPLRFLTIIFTDEELKADIRVIRTRSWVWDTFFEGLADSLQEESKNNNILPEYIEDFSKNVGIDPNLITPSIQARKWKELVNILIDKVPRSGDPGRYEHY
jgi:hypothetical protein